MPTTIESPLDDNDERTIYGNSPPLGHAPGMDLPEKFRRMAADITGGFGPLREILEFKTLFNVAQTTGYKELTYTSGDLTGVDVWITSGKATKLFTRVLSYTGADLTSVVTVNEQTAKTMTVTLVYVGGDLFSVNTVIT